jgi:hypothetical protein
MFFEFCGQGGANVFTTNSFTNQFSIQICLNLEPLEFLLSHHHPLTASLLVTLILHK